MRKLIDWWMAQHSPFQPEFFADCSRGLWEYEILVDGFLINPDFTFRSWRDVLNN